MKEKRGTHHKQRLWYCAFCRLTRRQQLKDRR
jgi:hypothetical protein